MESLVQPNNKYYYQTRNIVYVYYFTKLKKSLKQLKEQENRMSELYPADPYFPVIYQIISIYTSFVLDEPIHVVGSEFPGGFKVKYEDGKYLCPVKDKQENNPNAVCGFCIAEQDPELL